MIKAVNTHGSGARGSRTGRRTRGPFHPACPPPPCRAPSASRCADTIPRDELSRTVRAVILAGGETQNPLSKYRAMPAVPLGEPSWVQGSSRRRCSWVGAAAGWEALAVLACLA